MSALTLVMSELTDLDPEEFLNVRAYHTCGKNFRQVLLRGGRRSPANSDSSGISSLISASVSTAEEESSTRASSEAATATPEIPSETKSSPKAESLTNGESSGDQSPQEVLAKVCQVDIIEEVQQKGIELKSRIYFCGRDVLNLERNLQPYKWQLTSPLRAYLQPFITKHTKFNLKKDEEYPMFTCENCDFRQPLIY